jgi:hypothetical protein
MAIFKGGAESQRNVGFAGKAGLVKFIEANL